jgi:hypothetical protein
MRMEIANKSTVSAFTPDIQTRRQTETVSEARALDDMVTTVVTFLVAAAVGLVVLSEFYSSIDTSGNFSSVFSNLESTVGSVYGLLLVLPLIAVGAMAIGILSSRMGRR